MGSTSSAAVYKVQIQGSPPLAQKTRGIQSKCSQFRNLLKLSPKVTKRMAPPPPPRPFSENQIVSISLSLSRGGGGGGFVSFQKTTMSSTENSWEGGDGFHWLRILEICGWVHQNHDILQSFTISHRCTHGSLICNFGSKDISPPFLHTIRASQKQGNPIFLLDHDATTTTLPRASERGGEDSSVWDRGPTGSRSLSAGKPTKAGRREGGGEFNDRRFPCRPVIPSTF
jgi:hypothetical protein